MDTANIKHGIGDNLSQFLHLLLQVLFVGFTIGMMRTVVPALADSEFGVPRNSFVLLSAFVVAFGFVKGALNFVAGRLSERIGRKLVLVVGWVVALPIPAMVLWAPSWNWIVAATVLLGVNQGLTWSMTQTSMLDVARADQRGFAIGLNEFSGYIGVALAGIVTGYLAAALGAREGVAAFGFATVVFALLTTIVFVRETLPFAHDEAKKHAAGASGPLPRYPQGVSDHPSTWDVFALVTWRDKRFMALTQAGLVEKFVDALVWVFYPVFLFRQGVNITNIGWVVGIYAFVWGGTQLATGRISDRFGRHLLNILGMWICGLGVALMLVFNHVAGWAFSAGLSGVGMAMLYPNLSAAVADISHPSWRGSAIGVYRFWRDLGYGIGGLAMGIVANSIGTLESGFWFVAGAMFVSGTVLWKFGEETHPKLNPGRAGGDCARS